MAAIISAFAISAQTQTIVIQGPNGKLMADLSVPSLNTNEKKTVAILMHGFGSNRHRPLLRAIYDKLSECGIGAILTLTVAATVTENLLI